MAEAGQAVLTRFLAHRRQTEDLARRFPAEHAEFAPWVGAMGVAALIGHMALAHRRFVGVTCGGQPPELGAVPTDLPGVCATLSAYTEDAVTQLRGLDDARLLRPVTFRERTLPAGSWLELALEHEIHHKGQLFVYARLLGVEPPPWRKRG